MGGLEQILGGLFNFGSYQNPSDAASPYLQQAMQQLPQYFKPYMDASTQALPQLQQQYGQLVSDPSAFINKIGEGYKQSPGLQFQIQQGTQAANNAAAAGGMAGSAQSQQNSAGIANNLANQDYYNFLKTGLEQYGLGLQGLGGLYNTGANASMGLGQDMANLYNNQAQNAYAGASNQNQNSGGFFGSLIGGLGSLFGF